MITVPFTDMWDLAEDRPIIELARRVQARLALAAGERHAVARLDRGEDALAVTGDLAAQEG